jgi:hypothetical protein
MKMAIRKNNLSQGLPNQGLMQEKVQKGDFLKKPSKYPYRQCDKKNWA